VALRVIAGALGAAGTWLLASNLLAQGTPALPLLLLLSVVYGVPWNPRAVTLAVAAALPIASVAGLRAGMRLPGAEPLVISLLCGWCLAFAFGHRRRSWAPATRWSLLAYASLVAASIAAELLVQPMLLGGYYPPMWPFLTREYFIAPQWFPALQAGVVVLQSIALAAIAYQIGDDPRNWQRLAAMVLVGGVAAALLNIAQFTGIASTLATGLKDVPHLLLAARVNVVHGDINAGGSMFVMMVFGAGGFLAARAYLPFAAAALAVLCVGLWLTGSRASILTAAAFAVLIACAWALRTTTRWKRWTAAGVVAGMALGVFVVRTAYPDRFGSGSADIALEIRKHMAVAALKMTADRPVFGVGVGRFYDRSPAYMSEWVLRHYPRENAHNNFLQVLAELGITGLAAFAAVLVVALRGAPPDVIRRPYLGLKAGVAAFLLTCLSGHPLLTRDVSYIFFIALGLLMAGASRAPIATVPPERRRWEWLAIGVAVVLLAASLPVRARASAKLLDLENVARGLWSPALEGKRVRRVGRHAVFFVRADHPRVVIPFQARERFRNPVEIEVWLNGSKADRFKLPIEGWMPYRLTLIGKPARPGFHRVDLFVSSPEWTGVNPGLDAGVEMDWPRPPE
jgi:hypothetical protein